MPHSSNQVFYKLILDGKKHPMDAFFKSFLSKSNLSAPPLDDPTAYKILNIEQK